MDFKIDLKILLYMITLSLYTKFLLQYISNKSDNILESKLLKADDDRRIKYEDLTKGRYTNLYDLLFTGEFKDDSIEIRRILLDNLEQDCHRRRLRNWFSRNDNIRIRELRPGEGIVWAGGRRKTGGRAVLTAEYGLFILALCLVVVVISCVYI